MNERARFAIATLCGLVLAGIVHLAAVLAVPWLSERDAFSRLRPTLTEDKSQLVVAPGSGASWLPLPDPATAVAACAYDLDEGPARISLKTGTLFQSLAFHARGGGAFFAVTDRAAIRGALDLVVMTREQLDEALAAEDEDEPSRDVRIVAPRREGLVIVRALAAFPSLREEAENAVKSVACTIDAEEEEEDEEPPPPG
jgi:uncharacterized membrane protein